MAARRSTVRWVRAALGALGVAAGCAAGVDAPDVAGEEPLAAIEVSPRTATVVAGATLGLRATARYARGRTADVTATAQWTAGPAAVCAADGAGVVRALGPGACDVRAGLGAVVAGSATVTVTERAVRAVAVAPASVALHVADTERVPLVATARYEDGATRVVTEEAAWRSSAPDVAAVSDAAGTRGVVTAGRVGAGVAYVTASVGGVESEWVAVTVAPATELRAVAVTPVMVDLAPGGSQALAATGTFVDGHVEDVTLRAAWTSSDPTLVAVDARTGVVRSVGVGARGVTITAAVGAVAGVATVWCACNPVVRIAVAPAAATVASGARQAFTATATLADGTSQPLSSGAVWRTGDSAVARAIGGGVVAAVGVGTTEVSAEVGAVRGVATLTVAPAAVAAITVTPADQTISPGFTTQLRAVAIFTDGSTADVTTECTWSSENPRVASVSATGLVTGACGGGPLAITAAAPSGVRGSTNVTVTWNGVVAVRLSPIGPAPLASGGTLPFTATAVFSAGPLRDLTGNPDLTFTSSDPSVATISNAPGATWGVVSALAAGSTEIGAVYDDHICAADRVVATPVVITVVSP